ncbi:MAG: hypothetical protein LVR00_07985 [Rhabdochlamydiaceae bacterium]
MDSINIVNFRNFRLDNAIIGLDDNNRRLFLAINNEATETKNFFNEQDPNGFFQILDEQFFQENNYSINQAGIAILLQSLVQLKCANPSTEIIKSWISSITLHIYNVSVRYPLEMKRLVEIPGFIYNPSLTEEIKKIKYLVKPRFLSSRQDWFIFGTRFSHHLGGNLGNFKNTSKGAGYFLSGIAVIGVGIALSEPTKEDENLTDQIEKIGKFWLTIGGLLLSSPFVNAGLCARENNP